LGKRHWKSRFDQRFFLGRFVENGVVLTTRFTRLFRPLYHDYKIMTYWLLLTFSSSRVIEKK